MASIASVIKRWLDLVEGRSDDRQLSGSNVFGEGDSLYSYGRHFPLCEVLRYRGRNGRTGGPRLYLLNGDRFSVSTDRHQRETRSAIGGRTSMIVPFSALEAAGIDRSTIEPVEIRDDRWETWTEPHYDLPDLIAPADAADYHAGVWRILGNVLPDCPADLQYVRYRRVVNTEPIWRHEDGREQYHYPHPDPTGWERGERVSTIYDEWSNLPGGAKASHCLRGYGSWPTADGLVGGWHGPLADENREIPHELNHYSAGGSKIERAADGSWFTSHSRHWLGDSVFRARLLMPRNWDRWGEVRWQDTAAGKRYHYFVSSFDNQEPRPLYFLAELPRDARPTTVDEAIESLAPAAVVAAREVGLEVTRQGDIFGVPTVYSTRELTRQAAGRMREVRWLARSMDDPNAPEKIIRESVPASPIVKRGKIHGTDHAATEVLVLEDGRTYARGCLYHDVGFRERDHVRRRIGDGRTWHLMLRNRVPRNRSQSATRGSVRF